MHKLKQGTIRKRKDGYWEARYCIDRKQYSIYSKNQEECIRKLKEAVKNKNKTKKTLSLQKWYDEWMKEYKIPKLRPNSIAGIKYTFNKYILTKIGKKDINKITSLELQKILNSINHLRQRKITAGYLNNLFSRAHKLKLISDNPMFAVEVEKTKSESWKPLSIEQQTEFLKAIKGHRYEKLFIFYLLTGCRRNEALALKWENIDFENRTIDIFYSLRENKQEQTKSLKRTLYMTNDLYYLLKSIPKENDFIFNTVKNINIEFNKIINKLGYKKIVIHSLRHTFATRCYEANIPLKIIQYMLGHSTFEMTANIYTSILPKFKAEYNNTLDKLYPNLYPNSDEKTDKNT